MITDKAKELMSDYFVKLISGGTTLSNVNLSAGSGKIGTGGNNTSPLATTLDIDLASATVSAIATSSNTFEVKLSVAGSNITGKVIREAGIFDSNNNLLARVNFNGVGPFTASQTLEIFLIMEVE